MANFENLTCFVTLTFWFQTLFKFFTYNFIYDLITTMRYSKHELSKKKKQVVLPKKIVILPSYLFIMATFFCHQGGHCGEV